MNWDPPLPIPVLVLAAGSSTRFGEDKLLAQVGGQPLLAWTLETALDVVPADHLLVATAPQHDTRRELCDIAGVATLVVADAERGMGWTLQDCLDACPDDAPGAIVVLADDPMTLRALPGVLAAARRDPGRIAAVQRDPFLPHPVYLPRGAWPAPPSGDDDHGLRRLLDESTCWIEDDGEHPVDVDLPGDIERLRAALQRA
jgi:molybdenum cofactor cytidylyltransferase